jgi:hypothetical protein
MEASNDQPKRGEVGKQTYEMVQRLIAQGSKATEAFAEVANQTGRSAATVATAYYRTARAMPGGGGVKQRPRSKTAAAARTGSATRQRSSAKTTQALVRELLDAANALAKHVQDLDGQLAAAKRDSEAYAQIQRLIGTGTR